MTIEKTQNKYQQSVALTFILVQFNLLAMPSRTLSFMIWASWRNAFFLASSKIMTLQARAVLTLNYHIIGCREYNMLEPGPSEGHRPLSP